MLHEVVEVIDRKTGHTSESEKHRIGREVHVGELSLQNQACFYFNEGASLTSLVEAWEKDVFNNLEIITVNAIYKLKSL